jgi:hypothetical protein
MGSAVVPLTNSIDVEASTGAVCRQIYYLLRDKYVQLALDRL